VSKFKLTLDEFKTGDHTIKATGLTVYYREDAEPHIHRLFIAFENKRLVLKDVDI
jgi:hypothetical protein